MRTAKETAGPSLTLPRIFLLRLVALANFMRLSLRKAAHAAVSSAVWQEIRVRSVGMTILLRYPLLARLTGTEANSCE